MQLPVFLPHLRDENRKLKPFSLCLLVTVQPQPMFPGYRVHLFKKPGHSGIILVPVNDPSLQIARQASGLVLYRPFLPFKVPYMESESFLNVLRLDLYANRRCKGLRH
jgi:hypothetical protein